ncbi:MAG: sigma-70 family RNA polymerase sigma factor [Planctomycetes bacterium]|nr:sigma-70 family RNA polymerase sigma factor [Planctomycetota bacterium]
MNDQELIRRCRERDRSAQRELYARTSDAIYRLLLRMTGDADDAFDVAQDVYVKVFAGIDRFQGDSDVTTWIYRIAINEARQLLRRRRRYGDKLREIQSAAVRETPADAATAAAVDVREALARLPEYERGLIVLRHFNELSYEEMARVLDKPAGTIASALNRARRMLRDVLDDRVAREAEDSAASGHLTG